MPDKMVLHLIANAHLDPVWLWDWREGLNEGIITCRAILDLMDENPVLTCIRGEAALYEHIERHDPETFERIRRYVEAGRWDVVGGVYVQPDTNLTGTETMSRHFVRAQHYFTSRFGKPATVAWAADSFGHSAGLPEVFAAAGMRGFAFTRPGANIVPIAKAAFWWESPSGARVMGYRPVFGWYGCERHEMNTRLDGFLAAARKGDLENVGMFYGLGNHGGGPSRRQIAEIADWAAKHPEVEVVHSGLHRLFDALYAEIAGKGGDAFLPVHRGELNFCLRGCYASVAKFKSAFRQAEAHVSRAETCASSVAAKFDLPGPRTTEPWDALLFNSFHDILPGSSVERAYDDQLAWLGHARHLAHQTEIAALNTVARRIDTARIRTPATDMPGSVVFLAWNPHPYEYRGALELETCLDYRPIWAYHKRPQELPIEILDADGQPLPFQETQTEHSSFPELAWRKRVVVPVTLPALGWSVMEMAYVEGAAKPAVPADAVTTPDSHSIDNGIYRVAARQGWRAIRIERHGKSIFGDAGLSAVTVEDPWGAWGGMAEEPESLDLSEGRDEWRVVRSNVLETGPERATLVVRMKGGASEMDLRISLYRQRAAVDVAARVLWNERSARLKLLMPSVGDRAEFEVLGGVVERQPCGEVPGGRWVRVHGDTDTFGFASDSLYCFDLKEGGFCATVLRASRYANDVKTGPRDDPWRPVVDRGEFRFRFVMSPGDASLPRLARELEQSVMAVPVPAKPGALPRRLSLAALAPDHVQVNALKPAEDGRGWILRLQEMAGREADVKFVWQGATLELGQLAPWLIASWRLTRVAGAWQATRCNTLEA
ncbi:MAG: hypothetical protein A3K19_17540 [Lentisphaerae bacterium RIFOXYB12_FULL_65_16]|nr:MAG: hypothetical protein A3K18_12415 [Lentisphaerae bacterium RIFOXYA12_64_32]OGV85604.1 MAG: hypothetical protein A3K19_17540 [Lentisphaerae bacterium RIFOXYB12_FULL_65_16]